MSLPVQPVYGVPGDKQSSEIGVFIKRSGIITIDTELNQYFKLLHVGSGGNLVYKTPDDQIGCFLGVKDGSFIPVVGNEVLSSGVVDGVTVTTSCTDITWHGGE